MKNRLDASLWDRQDREWVLRWIANRDANWLGKLARNIVKNDPQVRSFANWLRAQGTGPPHIHELAYRLNDPDPKIPRVTRFQQTEKEYAFLKALLDLIANGHDVRPLLVSNLSRLDTGAVTHWRGI
jgi:hypothetical protein